eukprot:Skav236541  [mRNA]  locus=scaffold1774:106005:112667:+ [translate_table: standard]
MAPWHRQVLPFLAVSVLSGRGFVNCPSRPAGPRSALLAARDPWAVLELSPGASRDDVKKAFREKIRKAHPDAGGTAQEFKEVREAYQAALREAGTGSATSAPRGATRGWSINVFWLHGLLSVDASGTRHHWWTSAEQRAEQKQQAQSMNEAGGIGKVQRFALWHGVAWSNSRPRFEDDSVREWNDFLSKRQNPVKEKPDPARIARRRSEKIKDPVVTHRSIATAQGGVSIVSSVQHGAIRRWNCDEP